MIKDIKIIKNSSFKDKRGQLWTTWKKGVFNKVKFNHDKFSLSNKNSLRGIHCDFKSWKMITSVYGKFLLVVVDMRKNSRTYLKYKKFILDYKKPKSILIPPYFANAHLCLSKICYHLLPSDRSPLAPPSSDATAGTAQHSTAQRAP